MRLTWDRMMHSSGTGELEDFERSCDKNGNLASKSLSGASIANQTVKHDNTVNELDLLHPGASCEPARARLLRSSV
jgi:hypothetical protein